MLMSKGNDSQCLRSNIRDIVQNTNGVVSDAPGYVYSVVACNGTNIYLQETIIRTRRDITK